MKTLTQVFLCTLLINCGSTAPQSSSQENTPHIDSRSVPQVPLPFDPPKPEHDHRGVDFCLEGASSREDMLKDPKFIALATRLIQSGKSDTAKAIIAAIQSNKIICKNSLHTKGSNR